MSRFNGKVAIVTGSSAGIGRAVAELLVMEGASVTIHGQSMEKLDHTKVALIAVGAKESNIHVVQGPIQEEQIVRRIIDETVAKFGRLDVLVNNVGQSRKPDVADRLDIEHFDYVMAVNVRSVIALTRLAVPHLTKTKGNIVNVSSIAALRTSPLTPYYSVAKSALDSYTRNAAVVYGPQHVRVNAVNLGVIDTDIWKRSEDPKVTAFREKLVNETLVNRIGKPEEVARVIALMASDEGAFITGSCWLVDGGAVVAMSLDKTH